MEAARYNRFLPRRVLVLAVALGGLPLFGCTEKPESPVMDAGPAAGTVDQTPSKPPAAIITHTPAAVRARPPFRPSVQKAARKEPGFDPAMLVGLAPPDIDKMLGRPAGTRTDSMAVEWTYSAPKCSLSIFFYPDVATGTLKALKYNVTTKPAGDGRDCVHFPIVARSDESD